MSWAGTKQASVLLAEMVPLWRPPVDRTVSEWADAYRILPETSAEPGRWRTTRTPYLKDIMDSVNDPAVRELWFMSSSQVGKSECLNNVLGYFIDSDPGSVLFVQPTIEMAQSYSKERLQPMFRDTPCLRAKVKDGRAKDSENTISHKQFPGGVLDLAGANSPAGLASRPKRILLFDEVDRYPPSAGEEGDPVELAIKRGMTYWNRFVAGFSTPTVKDLSRIEKGFLSGDQRRYHVPCQHCGHKQHLRWEQLDFSNEGTLDEPVYRCESCGGLHRERHKHIMLRHGEWIAGCPFKGIASFHLNELYSPWSTWARVVADFYKAKKNGPQGMKVWKNTSMGETYEESGEVISSDNLMSRADAATLIEDALVVPEPVLVATWGADVQGDRIELHLIGWGEEEESWSIAYEIVNGAPSNPLTWAKVDEFLATEWRTASGRLIQVPVGGIDTGDGNTNSSVMEWVKPRMGQRRGVLPFKGASTFTAPIWASPNRPKKTERDKVLPYIIGVSQAKLVVHDRLKLEEPGPGYMHFPSHYDEHFFRGMTSEKLITRYDKGFPRKEWHKIRDRNEPFDTTVYAYAAMKILNPDFAALKLKARAFEAPEKAEKTEVIPAIAPVNRTRMRIPVG